MVSAKDKTEGKLIAVKKIINAFEHQTFTKRTLRELRLMRLLNHENILKIDTI